MKISYANLERIMQRCTKKEIDLIFCIGMFQDAYGQVKGISCKQVCREAGISRSTFYTLLHSLESKEIIRISYFSEHGYWSIEITDNVFANDDDYKKGYFKLNRKILHSNEFKTMTKSEKLIVLNLIKMHDFKEKWLKISLLRLAQWTGKSLRSVKVFINTLSKVFRIRVEDGMAIISNFTGMGKAVENEKKHSIAHLIFYRLKVAKCGADEIDINDSITVFKQYKINSADIITNVLDNTISMFGQLIPAHINKLAGVWAQTSPLY